VDFVAFDRGIIIELDGGQHNEEVVLEKDERRSAWMEDRGYRLLRFWNNEVLANMEGLLETIRSALGWR
jgi:very-short-patch-repair endonuclease